MEADRNIPTDSGSESDETKAEQKKWHTKIPRNIIGNLEYEAEPELEPDLKTLDDDEEEDDEFLPKKIPIIGYRSQFPAEAIAALKRFESERAKKRVAEAERKQEEEERERLSEEKRKRHKDCALEKKRRKVCVGRKGGREAEKEEEEREMEMEELVDELFGCDSDFDPLA